MKFPSPKGSMNGGSSATQEVKMPSISLTTISTDYDDKKTFGTVVSRVYWTSLIECIFRDIQDAGQKVPFSPAALQLRESCRDLLL